MHADYLRGMPVLLSYAVSGRSDWLRDYIPSFGPLLIDSGAFSEFNSGKRVDRDAYAEWAEPFRPVVDAVAALDDIRGDWERGLENWRAYSWMFPTFHDSDPWEALETILSVRPKWLGLGMVPKNGQRTNERWLAETLERLTDYPGHVHGWALRGFTGYERLDSVDSTNWFRDSWQVRNDYPWLTPAECVEIVVKRYQRERRLIAVPRKKAASPQKELDLCA